MAGRLEDVGLDARKLTFSEKDWNALEDVVDPLVPEERASIKSQRNGRTPFRFGAGGVRPLFYRDQTFLRV